MNDMHLTPTAGRGPSTPTRRRRRGGASPPDAESGEVSNAAAAANNALWRRKPPASAQRRHRNSTAKLSSTAILLAFVAVALVLVVGFLYYVAIFHMKEYSHHNTRRRINNVYNQHRHTFPHEARSHRILHATPSDDRQHRKIQHDTQDVYPTQDVHPMKDVPFTDTSESRSTSSGIMPIVIGIDANSLRIKSGVMPSSASSTSLHFISGMLETDEIPPEEREQEEQSQETHTIHAWSDPDPHATLPDGKIDVLQRQAAWEKKCVPMLPWQRTFRPTCNVVHETDLSSKSNEDDTTFLSAGGSWRMAWKIRPKSNYLDIEEAGESRRAYLVKKFNSIPELLPPKKKNCTSSGSGMANATKATSLTLNCTNATIGAGAEADEGIDDADYGHSMVLKMLRLDRPYNEETFSYNQRDIMAMDRFTASPFVIDAYGYCGESVMTEVAGGSGRELIKRTDIEPRKRLRIARNLAMGLSQIHGDRQGKNASLVHNDLNLANLVLVKTSTIKFNDFNIAMMGRYNPETNEPCGHPVLFESPLWRAPEEIRDDGTYVNEKVDMYAFGNILFQILTKHQPWTWLELDRPSLEEIGQKKLRGELPRVPAKYTESENMGTQALYIATMMCYAYDPEKRPSAWQLANSLAKAHKEFSLFKRRKRKNDLTFEELQEIFGLSS